MASKKILTIKNAIILFMFLIFMFFFVSCINNENVNKKIVSENKTLLKKNQATISEKDIAINECIKACKIALNDKINLSNGPCLLNPIKKAKNWVCDIAHKPRIKIDNDPKNQCSAFREGKANHFVELNEKCDIIRVY